MMDYHEQWKYSQEEVKRLTKENINSKGYKYKELSEKADELLAIFLKENEALKAERDRLYREKNLLLDDFHQSYTKVESERDEAVEQLKIMMNDERSAVKSRGMLCDALKSIRKIRPQYAQVENAIARSQSVVSSSDVFEIIDEALNHK